MLGSTEGGSSYSFSMPSRPAASMTANARYGLAAGSGLRSSARTVLSLPCTYRGTRISAVRLRWAHEM
jgi:hypothetical protein